MPPSTGTRLGPYEVLAAIGAGGMGEVYRARDSRLGRDVAIKVLPPAFAADPDRRARFEREAQTVAALSHPNIVNLFDTGLHDGQLFVVMELLEGQTLRERLQDGAVAPRKVIEYAVQVARGLAAAHDKGLVHRDLKPDNIFLLADGHVKILDFGLARAMAPESAGSGATETVAALTDPGLVMGTIGYMAPEQVRGRAVDARADLFAFGAVLYEMLTGTRAFQRDTPADTMTAILKDDPPDLSATRAEIPPALDHIIRHCLEKNPVERFQSARDVAFALGALSGSTTSAATAAMSAAAAAPGRATGRERIAWVLAALGLAGVTALVVTRPAAPPLPAPVRFSVPLDVASTALTINLAIAPDGHAVVVQSQWASRDSRLHLRRLDSNTVTALPGTEGGTMPFWSPDSQSIGFVADGQVKRFDLATSSVRPMSPALEFTYALAWSRDGTILFTVPAGPLHRISVGGGKPAPVAPLDEAAGEQAQIRPVFLPDGRRYLYRSRRAEGTVTVLASLDDVTRRVLTEDDLRVIWTSDDMLVFRRADALYAQRVDYRTPALVGEPALLTADLDMAGATAVRESVSDTGAVAYVERSNREQQFQWYGRDGRRLVSVGEAGAYTTFDLSKDGSRVVAAKRAGDAGHLWTMDSDRKTVSRITLGDASDVDPRWSPDGRTIIFGSTRDARRSAHRVGLAADTPSLLWPFDGRLFALDDWSRDGRWLLFHDAAVPVLKARELDAGATPKGEPVVVARALTGTIDQGQMSPDGRWVAYNSNESGQYEVYVVPFPPTGARFPVSRGGGVQPTWRADGGELYYLTPDGALVAVKVTASGTSFSTGDPVGLFRPNLSGVSPAVEQYAPHPTGQKFIVLDFVGDDRNMAVGVLLHWPSLIGR